MTLETFMGAMLLANMIGIVAVILLVAALVFIIVLTIKEGGIPWNSYLSPIIAFIRKCRGKWQGRFSRR